MQQVWSTLGREHCEEVIGQERSLLDRTAWPCNRCQGWRPGDGGIELRVVPSVSGVVGHSNGGVVVLVVVYVQECGTA